MNTDIFAPVPSLLDGLHSSTDNLIRWLKQQTSGAIESSAGDRQMQSASLLPTWSRAHVLTHLARNADGITRTLDSALQNKQLARYPDGPAGREADIQAGARRPSADLIADITASAVALDLVIAELTTANGWDLPTEDGRPAWWWLYARRREIEIHRIDLDWGYQPSSWPASFIETLLPEIASAGGLGNPPRTPLKITVAEGGSVTKELAGKTWTVIPAGASGDPVEVTGPDWALVCLIIGRTQHARTGIPRLPAFSS
jgi:maleylpyruvate isomerase